MKRKSRNRYVKGRRWIDPQDFVDARRQAGLTREEAAKTLDVSRRTVQNWETGGARIPWMAMRMLRILRGYALPGHHWEGWTIRGHQLFAPNGRAFDAVWLENVEYVFAQARLWRLMYTKSAKEKTAQTVVPFPERRKRQEEEAINVTVTQIQMKGGGR